MKIYRLVLLCAATASAQDFRCDLRDYKPMEGLKAELAGGMLRVAWRGERGAQLHAAFTLRGGQPVIAELGIGGKMLARNLSPEVEVTSGKRRLSEQQMAPLRALGIALTPEVIE